MTLGTTASQSSQHGLHVSSLHRQSICHKLAVKYYKCHCDFISSLLLS